MAPNQIAWGWPQFISHLTAILFWVSPCCINYTGICLYLTKCVTRVMIGKSFRDERRWTFFNGLENGSTNIVLWLSMLWLAGGCCAWWWNAGTISSLCSYYYVYQLTQGLDTENYEQLLCVNYWISLQRWAATVWVLLVVACLLCFCIFLFCWTVQFVF